MKNKLRVLQIIDSLSVGGAERVSVNYANALAEKENIESFLCVARSQGPLSKSVSTHVNLIVLNKKNSIDIFAMIKLIKFIKLNEITIIHAHTSSFFLAYLIRPFVKVKIIWHLHNGEMKSVNKKYLLIMKLMSRKFQHVITVNTELNEWAKKTFHTTKSSTTYLENYPDLKFSSLQIDLPGLPNKRIVSLGNLRYQKDHMNLLEAFNMVVKAGHEDWTLLLVGNDYKNEYSDKIKKFIQDERLSDNVYILGLRTDAADILNNSRIGVIASKIEGLPVSLLEYGLASLAVVSTNVGECSNALSNGEMGLVVEKENPVQLCRALEKLINNDELRNKYAELFNKHVLKNYAKNVIIDKLINIYRSL